LYAYKHRSKSGQWMFIFGAKDYNEAFKRKKYLEKVAELQQKQKLLIEQHQTLISKEKRVIEKDKKEKEIIANEKRIEKENLEKDKSSKQASLEKLKKEETRLSSDMKLKENRRQILRQRIREAINAEIAAEEARRKAREEKERKRLEEKQRIAKTENSTSSTKETTTTTTNSNSTETKRVLTISETKEVELNQHFETNRGRLPWPVERGTITEGYGKNPHPKLKNVFTNNNGIDITTSKGASVRTVFEGEVTSVISIPGAGKVVIIKHGNYRTVYSNLKEVYVSVGSKVKTKQAIGALLPDDEESISISHFEIHQVANGQINRINPSIWIAR
jgi:murein DD-endopeptidase MepM/ murein hydrolase activator NlpD